MGPDAVKYTCWGVVPSCKNSGSTAFKLNVIKSPALTVVEKDPANGGVITGALLAELQGITTNCISRSTSEINTPCRKDRTRILTK